MATIYRDLLRAESTANAYNRSQDCDDQPWSFRVKACPALGGETVYKVLCFDHTGEFVEAL